jgi:transcriptional regulator with XRE-family HTH domain
MNTFSPNVVLKSLRESHNKTQEVVAGVIGVSTRTYQNYELGKSEPSISEIAKLAEFYGIEPSEFFTKNNVHRKSGDVKDSPQGISNAGDMGDVTISGSSGEKVINYLLSRIDSLEKELNQLQGNKG